MKSRAFIVIAFLVIGLSGCSGGTSDLSQEKSPNATGPEVKSTGPAQVKAQYKSAPVGAGDGVVPMKSR